VNLGSTLKPSQTAGPIFIQIAEIGAFILYTQCCSIIGPAVCEASCLLVEPKFACVNSHSPCTYDDVIVLLTCAHLQCHYSLEYIFNFCPFPKLKYRVSLKKGNIGKFLFQLKDTKPRNRLTNIGATCRDRCFDIIQ
jgi:hypothetical protein